MSSTRKRSSRKVACERQEQALKNFQAVLAASGCQISDVAKTTVFLQDLGHFAQVRLYLVEDRANASE